MYELKYVLVNIMLKDQVEFTYLGTKELNSA